jgi:putative component of toxin-antitoxin plasmid stabilization module
MKYSVIIENDDCTLFDHFVQENSTDHSTEVKFIVNRIYQIGHSTGARTNFFKQAEGKPGDGVCALYDDENSKLRQYCIRYGSLVIILGGGGPKPTNIRSWQQDSKLKTEAERIICISKDIMKRIKDGDLYWSTDGTRLLGNLKISDNEE